MHLHRLTFQALGPFPGRHTVDFAALAASGLFLLEGPTGSGKSTVIDAIVFALYGKVASHEASEDRLRSGHADPAAETFVDLVFEAGPGIFRVRRTPAYARPKQRGTGTTLAQATGKLWRLTSPDAPEDGDLMATRLEEVGGELQRIIGLDRAQFVQTVVLPQGEFASFLRANPEDRRGLLQRVFGTQVYDRVEQRLAAMRVDAARTLQAARDGVALATEHFLGASGLADEAALVVREAASDPAGADRLLAEVARSTDGARADAESARGAATRAAQLRATTQQAVDEARRVVAATGRRDVLLAERAALATAAPQHEEDVRRLAVARRAQRVWPSVLGADQAAGAVARAEVSAQEAGAAARSADPALADLVDEAAGVHGERARLTMLAAERDACAARRARLTRPLGLEDGLPARRREIERATAGLDRQRAERDRLAAGLAARPEQRAGMQSRRDGAARTADGLAGAEAVESAQRRHTAAVLARSLATEETSASASVAAAASAAQTGARRASQLQQARIAGIAAELAVELVPGRPCPVCGGTEHPHPAAAGPEQVTAGMVAAAEAERDAADQRLAAAAAALAEVRAKREVAERGAEGLDVAAAGSRLEAARGAAEQVRAAVAERNALDGELGAFDAATGQLTEARAALDVRLAAARAELAAAGDRVAGDEAEVALARETAVSVRERAVALDERIAAIDAWTAALDERDRAGGRLAERTAQLAAALGEHGFDDDAAVRRAALDDDALAVLDAAIREHDARAVAVESGLAEPEVAALAADVSAVTASGTVARAEQAHAAADAQATRAEGEAVRLADRASSSAAAAAEVERVVADLARARREAEPVVRMANVVAATGGDNARQLSLGTYVLVRRFEDVVAAANSRLAVMSGGRYELARSEERERGGARKLGLAMKVLDHRTGTERDPRTLSGGETFYVSLCLALGLADVVTAEAGGIDLGTLFVDEGFGSLDAETLDVVLAELGRLREGGRVVGVVSHVEAMRQSIAERVEVRRTRDGASTLAVRA